MKQKKSCLLPLVLMTAFLYGCNIFEESDVPPNLVVNVAPASTAGSVLSVGSGSENGELQLTAIPNPNWSFSHWSGGVESTDNPLQFTLAQNTEIFANFVISGTESGTQLTVSDGQFVSELRFGKAEGATDSFDSGFDLEAPPPPPSGVLYAWFEGEERRLIRDFRNPFTSDVEWELRIVPGEDEIINLIWESDEVDSHNYTLYDESDEEIADLTGSGNLDINLSASSVFYIRN